MLQIKPARVPVGHTIRSALGVGVPFIVGALTGEMMAGMWIGLAALLMAPGEREGSHRLNLMILLISTPIAACGYLLGFAQDWPLWGLVPLLAFLAFIAGAIASYGAAWSVAGMQFLLVAAVAIGVPGVNWWVAFGWYFVGGLFYLAMMLVEFAVDRRRPQRNAVHAVVASLAELARARAADLGAIASGVAPGAADSAVAVRAKAWGAIQAASVVVQTGCGRSRNAHWTAFADLLDSADSVVALIVGSQDARALENAAKRLGRILHSGAATPQATGEAEPLATGSSCLPTDLLGLRIQALEQAGARMNVGLNVEPLSSPDALGACGAMTAPDALGGCKTGGAVLPDARWRWSRLALGRDAMGAALRLALVYGVAVAARAYFPWAHWFWVPLTVCLVMKPDFGSVFDRAILRVVGTVIGVLISTAVIQIAHLSLFQHCGSLVIAIAIMLLAALVPWFMMRAYTLQAVAIAPIVVLLVAVIQPDGADTNYSAERIGATIVGGILVLVLGYALWPSARRIDIKGRIARAVDAVEDYLAMSMKPDAEGRHQLLVSARRSAYLCLADLRLQLQRALGEAPPASTVAEAWLPAIAELEHLVDGIDIVAERDAPAAVGDHAVATDQKQAAIAMQMLAQLRQLDDPRQVCELAARLRSELVQGQR